MRLNEKTIRKIIAKNRVYFEALERYDRTREIDIGRARVDITLDKKVIRKLKELREKTGTPISRIIEEAVQRV